MYRKKLLTGLLVAFLAFGGVACDDVYNSGQEEDSGVEDGPEGEGGY